MKAWRDEAVSSAGSEFEEEAASFRSILFVTLLVFVPTLLAFSIYNLYIHRYLAVLIDALLLVSNFVLLAAARGFFPKKIETLLYRYIFRFQVFLLGILLVYYTGMRGLIEFAPWAFVFVFVAMIVFGLRVGTILVGIFLCVEFVALLFTGFPQTVETSVLLLRFFPAVIVLTVCIFSAELIRQRYRMSWYKTQSELRVSEERYRRTNAELASELQKRDHVEKQLRQAHAMEAVGRLAATVAHDLNNILSGIVTYPELLLLDLPDDSPIREPIETIMNSGHRAAAVVQDLLTMSRRGIATSEVVDLRQVVEQYLKSPECCRIIQHHPEIQIEKVFDDALWCIKGSPVHLSKTVMNLIANAVEAMPDGGQITVCLSNFSVGPPKQQNLPMTEGEHVVLSIADTGVGIPEEDIEHIFEPFYTKKIMGQSGSGLGMAVVWGTIEDHNGHIDVKSEVGVGTTIKLFLPATKEQPEQDTKAARSIQGDGELILVVDDVEEQRKIASSLLKRLGYQVATVSSGEEAIAYMQDHSVDLLMLDMLMAPGIDGLETYKRVLEIDPESKAILASGFSETERVRDAQALGAKTIVRKPYTLEQLGRAVQVGLGHEHE